MVKVPGFFRPFSFISFGWTRPIAGDFLGTSTLYCCSFLGRTLNAVRTYVRTYGTISFGKAPPDKLISFYLLVDHGAHPPPGWMEMTRTLTLSSQETSPWPIWLLKWFYDSFPHLSPFKIPFPTSLAYLDVYVFKLSPCSLGPRKFFLDDLLLIIASYLYTHTHSNQVPYVSFKHDPSPLAAKHAHHIHGISDLWETAFMSDPTC